MCRLRNCSLLKHFFLCIGHDSFEDFELMVLVHEVMFDSAKDKTNTVVQVTAGAHTVKTNPNSNGIFQQPLHITIEQGTEYLSVDLLTTSNLLLARVKIDVHQIYNEIDGQQERDYQMCQKGRGIHNPRIKLTMVVSSEDDAERGFVNESTSSDVAILVRQQLKKAKGRHGQEGVSEMDVLKEACAGPLELFEGLGQTQKVYVAVIGPPTTRRWVLGVWRDQRDFEERRRPVTEAALLKIQSIQADPQRNHVFVVNCYDESRVRQSLTFRRVDRNRDVWVEILHLLVMKAREASKLQRQLKTTHHEQSRGTMREELWQGNPKGSRAW